MVMHGWCLPHLRLIKMARNNPNNRKWYKYEISRKNANVCLPKWDWVGLDIQLRHHFKLLLDVIEHFSLFQKLDAWQLLPEKINWTNNHKKSTIHIKQQTDLCEMNKGRSHALLAVQFMTHWGWRFEKSKASSLCPCNWKTETTIPWRGMHWLWDLTWSTLCI